MLCRYLTHGLLLSLTWRGKRARNDVAASLPHSEKHSQRMWEGGTASDLTVHKDLTVHTVTSTTIILPIPGPNSPQTRHADTSRAHSPRRDLNSSHTVPETMRPPILCDVAVRHAYARAPTQTLLPDHARYLYYCNVYSYSDNSTRTVCSTISVHTSTFIIRSYSYDTRYCIIMTIIVNKSNVID